MRGTRGKSYSSEEELIPHFASDKGMLMLQATHMMFRHLQQEGGDDSKSSTLHFTRSVDSVRNRRKDETQPHGSGQGTAHGMSMRNRDMIKSHHEAQRGRSPCKGTDEEVLPVKSALPRPRGSTLPVPGSESGASRSRSNDRVRPSVKERRLQIEDEIKRNIGANAFMRTPRSPVVAKNNNDGTNANPRPPPGLRGCDPNSERAVAGNLPTINEKEALLGQELMGELAEQRRLTHSLRETKTCGLRQKCLQIVQLLSTKPVRCINKVNASKTIVKRWLRRSTMP